MARKILKTPEQVLDHLRRFCLALPESCEVEAWGHPNFRAGKKTFAVFEFYKDRPCVVIKAEPAEQQLLISDTRFAEAPYIGKHGWVSLWVDSPVDRELVDDLVLNSYRLVALKRMLKALNGQA